MWLNNNSSNPVGNKMRLKEQIACVWPKIARYFTGSAGEGLAGSDQPKISIIKDIDHHQTSSCILVRIRAVYYNFMTIPLIQCIVCRIVCVRTIIRSILGMAPVAPPPPPSTVIDLGLLETTITGHQRALIPSLKTAQKYTQHAAQFVTLCVPITINPTNFLLGYFYSEISVSSILATNSFYGPQLFRANGPVGHCWEISRSTPVKARVPV